MSTTFKYRKEREIRNYVNLITKERTCIIANHMSIYQEQDISKFLRKVKKEDKKRQLIVFYFL